jgi:addiction module HigA family antidote
MDKIELEHVGILLKEDFLDEMGIKPAQLARAIGVGRSVIGKIISGQNSITADMSIRFGLFFNQSSEFWYNLQTDYDMRKAREENLDKFKEKIRPLEMA